MANNINQILQELYELDSSLKNHEKELIKIINQVLIAKPNTKFDKRFAKQLRAQLLAKAGSTTEPNTSLLNSLTQLFTMKKLTYAGAGVVVIALIIIPVVKYLNPNKVTPAFDLGLKISRVSDNAFGSLEAEPALGTADGRGAAGPEFAGLGGGGLPRPQSGGGGLAVAESSMIMPPEYMINYKYVYEGDPITLDQNQLAVLKRIKGSSTAGQLASLLSNFDLGLADLSKFSDSKIQNISFAQDKPYGYTINANLEEGVLTIFSNWKTWPQGRCRDQKCFEALRTNINDVSADQDIIKIANDFLAKNKISLENYGQGIVDNNWRTYYEQSSNKANFYVPESLTVIYPLKIDGKQVYEAHGYPNGLNIGVNLKERKVMSVNNLFTQNYQSSMYSAITDVDKIMSWVEKGGISNYSYGNSSAKTYEVKLGQAKLGYFRKYNYKDGQNVELLVPALIFPVTGQPEIDKTAGQFAPVFNRQNVVVPLIKDVLAEYDQGNDRPIPRPMPEPVIMDVSTTNGEAPVADGVQTVEIE